MPILRKYKQGDPGHPSSNRPEIINSRPIPKPAAKVTFDVTPHSGVVTFSTNYETYEWNETPLEVQGEPNRIAVPAMFYHDVGVELTFTASLREENIVRNIVEYFWDFGDGTTAVGQTVTKTFYIANPGIIAHLRVTEDTGQESFASMNLMFKKTVEPPPTLNIIPYYIGGTIIPLPAAT